MTTDRVPVSLVTGFLGSGKTTLIAALLKQPAMAGTAVIVNEFGAVGIDDAIFAEALGPDNVALLSNGCMCCAAGDDLARAIWGLIQRTPEPPRRVVIETSGLADPAPALRRLMADPRLRGAIRLDSLVATVDAVNGPKHFEEQPVALRQCAVADRRVITKSDLAGPTAVAALTERLITLNPGTPVEVADHGAIDGGRLFGATLFDPETGVANLDRWLDLEGYRSLSPRPAGRSIHFSGEAAHDSTVGSWLIEETRPVDWAELSHRLTAVIARHGDRLLRLKGVIHTIGDERPLVVHGVQRVFHAPVRLTRWTRAPATSIVVIGDNGARPAVTEIAAALDHAAAVGQAAPAPLAVPA